MKRLLAAVADVVVMSFALHYDARSFSRALGPIKSISTEA